jgi:hypothetical protein
MEDKNCPIKKSQNQIKLQRVSTMSVNDRLVPSPHGVD